MADTRPIIATVRGTREQQELFKECAGKAGISLNAFLIASAIDAVRASAVNEDAPRGGPLNSERWTLDELLAELEKWKAVASGKTCVSFANLCYGASSLWHQTHRENFRKVDRKPEALSRWVLEHFGSVQDDFPAQVLAMLERLHAESTKARKILAHVPSAIAIKAKEDAGFSDAIRS